MALVFQRNQFDAERTGRTTTVPNNDVARLMYYLNCVCTTINCNDDADIQRFTNYENYSYLSIDEQKALVVVCYTFSPDVFDGKVFFHSDVLCGNSNNEFYTINQVRNQLVAVESIIIAGQARQVNKIMTYKMSWMKTHYVDPIQRLATKLSRPPPTAITYPSTTNYRSDTAPVIRQSTKKSSKHSCCCKCCTAFIIICVLVGIGIGIFFILRLRGIIKIGFF